MVTVLFKWKVTFSNIKGLILVEMNAKVADTIQRVEIWNTKIKGDNTLMEGSLEW
jgi:hypothetical protein